MSDKVSLIVGGSTGMGLATATKLASQGRTVILVGRDANKLTAAKTSIEAIGGTVETIRADVSTSAGANTLVEKIGADKRHIVELVNAAGTFFPKPFLEQNQRWSDIEALAKSASALG